MIIDGIFNQPIIFILFYFSKVWNSCISSQIQEMIVQYSRLSIYAIDALLKNYA
jgi:hypothetical protein